MPELLKYFLLGLVQGFTEPLPVSSSGHMIIFENLIGLHETNMLLEIIANTGSLIAVLVFYFFIIKDLIVHFFKYLFKREEIYQNDFHYCIMIIIATIPAGIAGLLLSDLLGNNKSLILVGINLIITAIALLLIAKLSSKNTNEKITWINAILIGLFQVIGILPGISRSGATTVGGVLNKINLKAALKFSFMLYIPISLAALIKSIYDISKGGYTYNFFGLLIAFVVSAITTYLSLFLLHKIVNKQKYHYFAFYCLPVGLLVLIWGLL